MRRPDRAAWRAPARDLGIGFRGARRARRHDRRRRRPGGGAAAGVAGRRLRRPCHRRRAGQRFDATLYEAAVAAGAEPVHGRVYALAAADPTGVDRGSGWPDGRALLAGDVVIGADGANSQVAAQAGLVDAAHALWGFALRSYLDAEVALPHIVLWEPDHGSCSPGYGWAFPAEGGGVNVGLGVAFRRGDRTASRQAGEQFGRFLAHLARLGLPLDAGPDRAANWLGGWLKMGMVGTVPARGRVLLVGDAAGMVNPLQGEGIAQAMAAGRAAATRPSSPGRTPRGRPLPGVPAGNSARHHRLNAAVHAEHGRPSPCCLPGRTRTHRAGRTLRLLRRLGVVLERPRAGGLPSRHRSLASALSRLVATAVARQPATAWFARELDRTRADNSVQR